MSWGETLADDPDAFQEHLKGDREDPPPAATVVAPCCGRECGADMVVDLRQIPGADRDWACDACRGKLIRDPGNAWTKPKLLRATGAPASVVRTERARELVAEKRRQAGSEVFSAVEAQREVEASMSSNGMPEGTEPPG